ncbi:MAG: DUF4012 domain-containing protein [Candidatus Roizmanbacteria bacterium]
MNLVVEEYTPEESACIIYNKYSPLIASLKEYLLTQGLALFENPSKENEVQKSDFCYAYNLDYSASLELLHKRKGSSICLITSSLPVYEKLKVHLSRLAHTQAKIVLIPMLHEVPEKLCRELVSFSQQAPSDIGLDLTLHKNKYGGKSLDVSEETPTQTKIKRIRFKKKRFFFSLFFIGICMLFFFIIPASAGYGYLALTYKAVQAGDMPTAKMRINQGTQFSFLAQESYSFSRPILSFFFLGYIFDNPLSIEQTSYQLAQKSIETFENAGTIGKNIVSTDPISAQDMDFRIHQLKDQVIYIQNGLEEIAGQLNYSDPKIKALKKRLTEAKDFLAKSTFFTQHLDEIIGSTGSKKYLVYFYNNMELRPGGGFIGSLAIVTFKKYKLESFDIHDVYDIDGKLEGHIDPPDAIRTYMNQPHWFLRDSNFSPDFEKNIANGAYFLEKSLGMPNDFDGVFGITTTTVANLLEAYDKVYLADYSDTITKDNFYLKTQLSVEDNFFPGSIQKKSYLSSLAKSMILQMDKASVSTLARGLEKSLTEKQLVMQFKDPTIQKDIDQTGWHGKVLKPTCFVKKTPCISDYLLPVDANLGVNKTNLYVSRSIYSQIKIVSDKTLEHTVYITFKNASPLTTFPGGDYKNFFRLYIPQNAQVLHISDDGNNIKDPSIQQTTENTYVQLFLIVPPKQSRTIEITYQLPLPSWEKKFVYQLIVQKQIGSINNDLSLKISYDSLLSATPQNFQALAKDRTLDYNTTLSNDRIFIIDFLKK